jgi:glycosyltransferase involved in cell wall biosynthesis
MDFVTITDHDTISGALEIVDEPGVFLSEELTAWFRGEPQAVHVLCYGISPADHEWLQMHSGDVEECAEYLHDRGMTCALAHPFYAVEAPLTPRHRRRLAQLFPIWETRNGTRARELNAPAAVYIEVHGGGGVGGSDDHAGVDIGRTFTETPRAATPEEFLALIQARDARPRGAQGSAAKWAHCAMALAVRALGPGQGAAPDPRAVLEIVERVMSEGDVRRGADTATLGPEDARDLLRAWLAATGIDLADDELIAHFQSDDFSHADLFRRARNAHERELRGAVAVALEAAAARCDMGQAVCGLFTACIPAVPYVGAAAFLAREKAKLAPREGEPERVALVADAVGGMHGVTHTLDEIRGRGVPGFEVEVVGTDPNVDRRLPAATEVEIPLYPGLQVGVPSVPALVETLAEGRYDVVHLCSPGPAGVLAALVARIMEIPVVGSYHTELGAYTGLRSGDAKLQAGMEVALAAFYGNCALILSPSAAADHSVHALGIPQERIARWDRGVDTERFDPARRRASLLPGELNVLYAGRLTREKGADLLASAFLAARERDPRLHLALAGGGPEEQQLRERLGPHATFLGWLEGEALAEAYASADLFLFASRTDTFGQVILEAQASGLPVVAVDEGGPRSLIDDRRSGRLCPPDAGCLADAIVELAGSQALRRRMAATGRAAAAERTWDAALARLAAGYRRVLATPADLALGRAA